MKFPVLTLIFTAFFAAASLCGAPVADSKIHPPHHPRTPGMGKPGPRTPDIWRAFSRLSPEEQRKLMLLQRSEPEKFRQIMLEKARNFQELHQARRQEIQKLAAEIRECKDQAAADVMRNKLKTMVKEDFDNRMNHLRRTIELNKKRLTRMEQELKKRQTNADAIVEAITNGIISGKHPGRRGK